MAITILDNTDKQELETKIQEVADGIPEAVEAEKGNIVDEIIAELQGLPVFGVVDTNNVIKITSQLSGGEYTLKYENTGGTYSDVGTITIGSGGYTNLADPTLATDNPLTAVSEGWIQNSRINSSYNIVTAEGLDVTNIIDVSKGGTTLRMKGLDPTVANGRLYFIKDNTCFYYCTNDTIPKYATTAGGDYLEITIAKILEILTNNKGMTSLDGVSIRFGGVLSGTKEDVIITIDEEFM